MCEKCEELDVKIKRYRRISMRINDTQMLESIAILIAEYEAQKKALHPESP